MSHCSQNAGLLNLVKTFIEFNLLNFTCQDISGERLHGRLRVDALRHLAGVLAYRAGHRQPWVRGTVGIDLRLPACMNQVSRHADGLLEGETAVNAMVWIEENGTGGGRSI